LRKEYFVVVLCRVLDVSTSGYYAYLKRPEKEISLEDLKILGRIKQVYKAHAGTYGAKRISKALGNEKGNKKLIVNHKKVARLMREEGLKAKVRRPKSTKESKEHATGFVYKNLLNRDFKAERPNEKWVTDLTEIWIGTRKFYISAILDLFNNEIVASIEGSSPNQELVAATVRKAMKARKLKTLKGIIIHSDQGSVYRSFLYYGLSQELRFTPSMSRKGNCWDNAVIESFFSQFKTEFPCFYPINTAKTFIVNFHKYIRYYNEKRIQKKTGFVPPKEYYKNFIKSIKIGA